MHTPANNDLTCKEVAMQSRTLFSLLTIVSVLVFPNTSARGEDVLVWSDEFDGTSLNTANWEPMIGDGTEYGNPGWGNNELEYYTGRTENVYVADGFLHIVAREESYAGHDYTSARIRTANKQEFLYGRLEARLKLPSTQGIWPAFWMLPTNSPYGGWAAGGEIDIMESTNIATTTHGTIHYGGLWPANTSSGGSYSPGVNLSDDFHVYAIQWEPDFIRWYFDGFPFYTVSSSAWYSANAPDNDRAPFDVPFHFLLNVAVGGNWPGYPDASSVFPQEMVVDWVRVYTTGAAEQTPYPDGPHAIPGIVEAENYDDGGETIAYHDCDGNNNGGEYRPGESVDIEECSEGGYNVGWMCQGEWLEYTVDVAASGYYDIEIRVASESTGGVFHLEFDGEDKTGDITIDPTGGWQAWTTVTATATLSGGEQIMRFVSTDSGEFNLNRFTFIPYPPFDLNKDRSVDLADFALFTECLGGPGNPIPPATCNMPRFRECDFDDDFDVDLQDFLGMQQSLAP